MVGNSNSAVDQQESPVFAVDQVRILLAWTGSPEVAESSEAAVVLPDGEEAPRSLPSGQDPAHLMQRLVP